MNRGTRPSACSPAYSNAGSVLPSKLLREIQRHFEGGLLWIPARRRRRIKTSGIDERDLEIVRERARGVTTARLAAKYRVSRGRVRQILRERKEMPKE